MNMNRLCLSFLFVLVINTISIAGLYWDDGQPHTINDDSYEDRILWVDYHIANNPGTHVDLVDGIVGNGLRAYNNATILMTGGSFGITTGGLESRQGIYAYDNVTIDMQGGAVGNDLNALGSANVTISGGEIGRSIKAKNNATVTVKGGYFPGRYLNVYDDGVIYLEGYDFEINGKPLSYGDKLSDYGILVENGHEDYYSGVITGKFADSTQIDNNFRIFNTGANEGSADIIIVPEPAMLIFSLLGCYLIYRRKMNVSF
ncbi:MAG: hypothetical protein JEZ07_10030 [Phycisphaerae bacterium]|nr:hypothetical protein [Phycisphaerae bacterium]